MAVTVISSRDFRQDTSGAKKAAKKGPVFITDRGRPSHVLMTIDDYQKLIGSHGSIIDMLAMPGVEDIEFDAPRCLFSLNEAQWREFCASLDAPPRPVPALRKLMNNPSVFEQES